jgi:hypothetical protein
VSKRTIAVFVITGALFILFLFLILKRPSGNNQQAVTAIPSDAVIILKANGLLGFCTTLTSSNYWQNLPANSFKKEFDDFIASTDSLGNENSSFNGILTDSTIYFSLHQNENNTLGFLVYLPFGTSINKEILAAKLYLFFSRKGFNLTKYKPGSPQPVLNQLSNLNPLYYLFEKGLLIIGNNYKTLSESYLQLNNKKNILSDTCFTKVYSTTGKKVPGNIFINMQKISPLFSSLINKAYFDNFDKTLSTGGWTALDVNIEQSYISLHGFSVVDASKQIWHKAVRNEQPADAQLNKVLPSNTIFYGSLTFSDPYNYKLAYNSCSRTDVRLAEKLKKLRQLFGCNIDEKLFNIIAGSFAMIVCREKGGENKTYCLVKTRGNMEALDYISLLKKNKTGTLSRKNLSSSLKKDTLFEKMTFQKLPCNNLPSVLFGNAMSYGNYPYVCNYKEYLLFGETEENLRDYFLGIAENKNISGDSLYQNVMTDLFSSKANVTLYFNNPAVWNLLNSCFSPETAEKAGKYLFNVSARSALGIQVSGNGQFLYNNIFLYSETREYSGPELAWSLQLDTSLEITPVIFEGTSIGKNQYFLQDKKNNIYLISSTGKILWKHSLGEKILGTAFQIDYYKNNKQQILFNTAEKLYLIDKKGRNVKGFPVKFKSAATNGIAINDFDGNKNYRYYIAFENKTFLALSRDGKKVDGWKFNKTSGYVTKPAQLFNSGNKDYILISDPENIYLLNRKGEQHMKVNRKIVPSVNNSVAIDIRPDFYRLIISDSLGQAMIMYPDGHVEIKNFGKFSGNHYFDYADINEDGIKDFFIADGTKLCAYSNEKKELIKVQLTDSVLIRPQIIKAKNGKIGIFICLKSADKLIMLDKYGKNVKGFPINGNFPMKVISLADDNYSYAILTGIADKLNCYFIR